jgi:type VI secretion system protein ImpF
MAETRRNRLSAPLMLAFRSRIGAAESSATDAGDRTGSASLASRRYEVKVAVSEQLLRTEVLRDLGMLVNTVALESTTDLTDLPHVRASILNFGIPDIAAHSIDEAGDANVGRAIETALGSFEPRLVPGTIRVVRDIDVDAATLGVRFAVTADLICTPVNVPVQFIADVELASQKISIKRL